MRSRTIRGNRAALAAMIIGAGLFPVAAFAGGGDSTVRATASERPAPAERLGMDDGLWRIGKLGASGKREVNTSLSERVRDEAGQPRKLAKEAGPLADLPNGPLDVPGVALDAYKRAAGTLAERNSGCGLPWSLLAAVGRIESGHARGGQVTAEGRTVEPILGPVLDGTNGTAAITDTDGGRLDGDPLHDRAVGPMQFIPSTWRHYADSGHADPNNLYDSALATGKMLCSGGSDLADPKARAEAVFAYNHSEQYVRNVLIWSAAYASGVRPTAVAPSVAGLPPLPAPNPEPAKPPKPPAPQPPQRPPQPPKPAPQPSGPPSSTSSSPPSSPSSSAPSSPPSCPPTTSEPSETPSSTPSSSSSSSSSEPSSTPEVPPGCPVPSQSQESATEQSPEQTPNLLPGLSATPSSPAASSSSATP